MLRKLLLSLSIFALLQPTGLSQSIDQSLIIPEGTELQLTLREPVSSKLSEPGDEVYATLRRDVIVDGLVLLRRGTEFSGRVTLAKAAGRPFKGGRLHITFERVRIDGRDQRLTATIRSASDFSTDEKVKSDSEGTLKGGASGGDIIQNIGTAAGLGSVGATIIILAGSRDRGGFGYGGIGGGSAAAAAGVMGGSVIAGLLLTKGKEVRLDSSAILRLRIERPLKVD